METGAPKIFLQHSHRARFDATERSMQTSPDLPRHALVTGGGRRIGRSIALALAGSGFAVTIHCNASRNEADATAAEIQTCGGKAIVLQASLDDEDAVQTLIPAATAALGPLGLLVNNASLFERDEWNDASRDSWDAHMSTNLRAPFVLIQDFARQLPSEARGLVVNLLDERVWSLTPHFVSYTISKAALWTLTQTMALALAPRIRVNGIGPGPTLPSARQTEAQFTAQCDAVPLQHGSSPEEIAAAVLAMLHLPSMTGQMIALDGGQHMLWGEGRPGGALEE
jgi:NAD(P)-dependent dehydrogenase (short-subunit alcohol dehydrogenase family)